MREFPLLDSFSLTPRQRTWLISEHQQKENLDLLFAKAEAFSEINIRVFNRKIGIKYYHFNGVNINWLAFWLTKDSNFVNSVRVTQLRSKNLYRAST